MRRLAIALFVIIVAAGLALAAGEREGQGGQKQQPLVDQDKLVVLPKFEFVDVYINTKAQPLGAYQLQVVDENHQSLIVGIEGSDAAAFNSPPYYDPAAMRQDRVILAAYSTAADLPRGRTRIARINLQVKGALSPKFNATLESAADAEGNKIPATVELIEGAAP